MNSSFRIKKTRALRCYVITNHQRAKKDKLKNLNFGSTFVFINFTIKKFNIYILFYIFNIFTFLTFIIKMIDDENKNQNIKLYPSHL